MDKHCPTLAIYGIADISSSDWPALAHDHSIAVYDQGHLIDFVQLERVTRNKRDNKLPQHLYDLLKEKGLLNTSLDRVFVDNGLGRAFISEQGNIRFEAPLIQGLETDVEAGRCYWLDGSESAYALNHELAHIFSSLPFYGSFKDNSLLIHFDGGASQSNFSAWLWKDNQLSLIEYHWDLQYISGLFNANALSFGILGADIKDQNAVPGKLMGFASFGQYDAKIETWLKTHDYFKDQWRSKKEFYSKAKHFFGYAKHYLDQHDPLIQNIAATFQAIFTRELLNKLRDLQEHHKTDYLYYTGGCALNIVTNRQILNAGLFKDVFIPPCAEDSGLALGAGAFMEFKKHGSVAKLSPYLNNWGIKDYQVRYDTHTIEKVAEQLMQKKVIGVCNGSGEVGPRALGNRSLLALANCTELTQKVSQFHKQREWYRPVAPIMLHKHLNHFTGMQTDEVLSQYMLLDFPVLPDKQKEIQGAVHVNGSARIQTVKDRQANPFLYDLLNYLDQHHSIRALINTSFNHSSEPIVHRMEDALQSAIRMRIDGVVLNGNFVALS